MIALALVMMRRRRARAVTVFLLATVAIAAAVAAPVYVAAAQRGIAAVDIEAALPAERAIEGITRVLLREDPEDPRSAQALADAKNHPFDRTAYAALTLPGFTTVFSSNFITSAVTDAARLEANLPEQRLEFREDFCRHVVIAAGRCVASPGEILVGERQAARLGVVPGQPLIVQAKSLMPDGAFSIAGEPATLSVVGIYRARDDADLFWGNLTGAMVDGRPPQRLLVDRITFAAIDHPIEFQSVVAYAQPGTLHADRLAALRADLRSATTRLRAAGINPITAMGQLLDRVERDRRQATTTPTVAAVPLILLCCFVVFLAAASTVQARRVELGMLKLRGAGLLDRWWLACAEVMLPVLAGGFAGYLLGHVAVWLFVRPSFMSRPTAMMVGSQASPTASLTTEALPYAAVALAAALGAGLLALRRDLAAPALDLLRQVPARTQRWGGAVVRTMAVVLAMAAVVQLRSANGGFSGLSLIAPAMVILAVALVSAAAFDRLAGWWGRRALRRGRLGVALAALHLGRRRAGSRVLALLVVAVGLVGFAAAASEVATVARTHQVEANLGADRVLQVNPMSARALLETVRAVDPGGAYAMAVMPMHDRRENLPVLAVDTPRLAQATRWPGGTGAPSLSVSAAAMRPSLADPVVVRGTGLVLRAALSAQPSAEASPFGLLAVTVHLAPLDGSPPSFGRFPPLRRGDGTYTAAVPCPKGCRLAHLTIQPYLPEPMTVTLTSLRQTDPDAELVGVADFARWQDRQAAEITMAPGESGLSVTVDGSQRANDGQLGPADVPDRVNGVAVGNVLPSFGLWAGTVELGVTVQQAATAPELPRVGGRGALVDLEYLARIAEPGPIQSGEVWLGPGAPADVVDRLRAAGAGVIRDRRIGEELAASRERPNAVGIRFFLAVGALCLLLGAGGLGVTARIERQARADELRALRAQGLSRAAVARAGRISYLVLVLTAGVFGAVAAAVAWFATGERLPLVDVLVPGVPIPRWPSTVTLGVWGGAVAVLAVAAVLSAWTLTTSVNGRLASFADADAHRRSPAHRTMIDGL